jgi:WS/DGAT/MGAT family acyltransferase
MLPAVLTNAIETAIGAGRAVFEKGADFLNEPGRLMALGGQGAALATEIGKLAMMSEDSPTRFKGTPGGHKKVAWAKPLPLSEVKAIGRALSASVNDVLLCCVTGALRAYLVARGDPVDGVMLRALVPVNLRPLDKAHELGNQFGIVFLDLPIGIENPVERLQAVRANMNALKGSMQPVLALGLLAAAGAGPKVLQEQLVAALARNGTAVMTNVPGPSHRLYFARARIESLMFWVPQAGNIGMGVSILSYHDEVQFGLITDRALCPDPERVMAQIGPEFEKLVLVTLLAPWPRDGDLDPAVAAACVALA